MKPSKDFYVECNEGGQMNPPEFERTFCNQCKNRECVRASWAFSNWDRRILTQVDRLLVNPNIVGQKESSKWEGISDFERFNEPVVHEVWGVSDSDPTPEIREEEDTHQAQAVKSPSFNEEEEATISVLILTNPLNTPPQEISLGENKPKRFQSDPWSVTETLPVGGKFKMGK